MGRASQGHRAHTEILSLDLSGRRATLTLRPDATIVGVGPSIVSSYDLSGRPYVLLRGGASYRRALDGRVLEKRPGTGGEPRLRRRWEAGAAGAILEPARREVEEILDALARATGLPQEQRLECRRRLEKTASMDGEALDADAERFRATYARVGMLPPDQYLAVVLQATQGCSWNACAFCDLYRGIPFKIRTPAEFTRHVMEVGSFFGESMALRRSVFIGDANALCIPHDPLVPLLTLAGRIGPAAGGVFAFVDVWTGRRISPDDYREYARLGLRRVYVGLETGDPKLLAWLGKPGLPEQAVELVASLHAAEVGVGVIVLVGAGGDRFQASHARNTAAVLSRMRLRADDIVYFSEIVEPVGPDYGRRVRADHVRALDEAEIAAQRAAIAASLVPADHGRPPRRVSYDVREFVY